MFITHAKHVLIVVTTRINYRMVRPILNIDWLGSCEVGTEQIDTDHQRLIAAHHRMREAFFDRRYTGCRQMIVEFRDDIAARFARAEAAFVRRSHRSADRHVRHHAAVLVRIDHIHRIASEDLSPFALADQLDTLAAAVMTDLIGLDLELRRPARRQR